jgi:nanoRNase/pAp phosphatase (c-di-AMP/oligoRNAs hydrolase)
VASVVSHPGDDSNPVPARLDRLLDVVRQGERVLICTHDNPDPDSIASAFALGVLLEARRSVSYTLTYGGVLGRAENRAMVKLLKIPLLPIHKVDLASFDVVGLVDTQPEVGNHALTAERTAGKRMLCIDHHPAREGSKGAAFADVGDDYGATSSLLAHYLEAAGVEPSRTLATALFYGIKSDTRDLGREVGPRDLWAYTKLISLCDMTVISQIEHPPLPRAYFSVLMRAVKNATVHDGDIAACDLGHVYVPDLVAETADRLAMAEGIRWTVVVGEYEGDAYASIRVNDRRYSAGKLVREAILHFPMGSAGGHGSMAGARVPIPPTAKSAPARARVRRALLEKILIALDVDEKTSVERFCAPEARAVEVSGPTLRALSGTRP